MIVISAEQRVERDDCNKGLTTSNNDKIERIRHVDNSLTLNTTRLRGMNPGLPKGPTINPFNTRTPRPAPKAIQLHNHHQADAQR